jgi:hypothetical protein
MPLSWGIFLFFGNLWIKTSKKASKLVKNGAKIGTAPKGCKFS